jgi:N-acetyl-anhydromuramyl-L-alanine amidase AmpD
MNLFCRTGLLAFLLGGLFSATMHADSLPFVSRAEWNAVEPRPYRQHTPKRFTIHHTAVVFTRDRDAGQHIRNIQVWGMGPDRGWADIPYHFLIAPNGDIFEGRDPMTEGESATPYDTSGHLQINLLGNFSEQEPTPEQLESLVRLLAWAHEKFDIPTETIAAHKDFASTACPGANLYPLVEDGTIRKRADELIARKGGKPRAGQAPKSP